MKSKYNQVFWQTYALAYDELLHVRPYKRYLEHMISQLTDEGPILDLGCGTANLWKFYPHASVPLTLVDGSGIMLDKARRKLKKREGTHFVQFNMAEIPARRLPFPDSSFAQIVMGNALYPHIHPMEILRECKRILVPQGRFVISDPKPEFKLEKIFQGHIGGETRVHGKNSLFSGLRMLAKSLMVDPSLVPHAPALAFIIYCNVLALSKSPTFISTNHLKELLEDAGLNVISVEDSYEGQNSLIVAQRKFGSIDDNSVQTSP